MCTISSSSLGDLLSSLLCSKQGPQGHADEVSVLKDIPPFRILTDCSLSAGQTGELGPLAGVGGDHSGLWGVGGAECFLLLSAAALFGLGVVSPSLGVTDFASVAGDGMANQAVLEILLGLADLPQAGIISLPGNRRRHQGTVTDCDILGLGFLELLKERK